MHRNASRLRQRARRHRFTKLVQEALSDLPEPVQAMLNNVAVIVEDEPSGAHLRESADGVEGEPEELFGLYQGIPLSRRDSHYSLVTPDRITVFQGPLERAFRTRVEMREQVRVTVLHELAHHIGFEEDQLERMGLA
jgi:predicted Zn-dependent protease with MMP-like domain